jgi:hypothetical protein
MRRYFFHLYNDVDAPDQEGMDYSDLDAAKRAAAENIRFTMAETIKEQGSIDMSHRVDIEDEQGAVLATVYFRDAVEIRG